MSVDAEHRHQNRKASLRDDASATAQAYSGEYAGADIKRIKKRADFLRVAKKGGKVVTRTLVLQAWHPNPDDIGHKKEAQSGDRVCREQSASDAQACSKEQAGAKHKTSGDDPLLSVEDGESTITQSTAHLGFTVTKKVGNAVVRNRVKRRLREVVRLNAPELAVDGAWYVVIGRYTAVEANFAVMRKDLRYALRKVRFRP